MPVPVLFLDEESRHRLAVDTLTAKQTALRLISTLKAIRNINKRIAVHSEVNIHKCRVSEDHNIRDVLLGNGNKEEWDFLRALNNISPLEHGREECLDEVNGLEVRTKQSNISSKALTWARFLDTGIISFKAGSDWFGPEVKTICLQVNPESPDGIERYEHSIRNMSTKEHVAIHKEWLRGLCLAKITPESIWRERKTLFPRMRFLNRVENGFLNLGTIPLNQAYESLIRLHNDLENWKDGPSPSYSQKVTPEGEQRKKLCSFQDSETQQVELFDLHLRFTGGIPGRIHFRLDRANKSCVVAHVGTKLWLRTVLNG